MDISAEMVIQGKENLNDLDNAHIYHAENSDLRDFKDNTFDAVFSYAVFQHIPSKEVVDGYMSECLRVVKYEGLIVLHFNSLPSKENVKSTWCGVTYREDEIKKFCSDNGVQLISITGNKTLDMWVTIKNSPSAPTIPDYNELFEIKNGNDKSNIIFTSGNSSNISLCIKLQDAYCDINRLSVRFGGLISPITHIGSKNIFGVREINSATPTNCPVGSHDVSIWYGEKRISKFIKVLVQGRPNLIPKIIYISDGIEISSKIIKSDWIQVAIDECIDAESVTATIDGKSMQESNCFCSNYDIPRHLINFRLPANVGFGYKALCISTQLNSIIDTIVEVR